MFRNFVTPELEEEVPCVATRLIYQRHFRRAKMAAAVQNSHVSPAGKLKRSLKKKKKMKMVAKATMSKLEDEVKDSSYGEGNVAGRSFGG